MSQCLSSTHHEANICFVFFAMSKPLAFSSNMSLDFFEFATIATVPQSRSVLAQRRCKHSRLLTLLVRPGESAGPARPGAGSAWWRSGGRRWAPGPGGTVPQAAPAARRELPAWQGRA